jgi:hypothetical protein
MICLRSAICPEAHDHAALRDQRQQPDRRVFPLCRTGLPPITGLVILVNGYVEATGTTWVDWDERPDAAVPEP